MYSKVAILLGFLAVSTVTAQTGPSCVYSVDTFSRYICTLSLNNPNGFNNFTSIDGEHLAGRVDMDVRVVVTTNNTLTTNVPRIICDTFRFTHTITITNNLVGEIGADSFTGCTFLEYLTLDENKIMRIAPNAFASNIFLSELRINNNYLQELPSGIFRPLIYLNYLYLSNNYLQVIHTDIFGTHTQLQRIALNYNRISAISPAIVNNTAIIYLHLYANICVNDLFSQLTKEELLKELETCINNYQNLNPNPTPPPDSCSQRNIFERVCELEDEVSQQKLAIEVLTKRVDELTGINSSRD